MNNEIQFNASSFVNEIYNGIAVETIMLDFENAVKKHLLNNVTVKINMDILSRCMEGGIASCYAAKLNDFFLILPCQYNNVILIVR